MMIAVDLSSFPFSSNVLTGNSCNNLGLHGRIGASRDTSDVCCHFVAAVGFAAAAAADAAAVTATAVASVLQLPLPLPLWVPLC